MRWASGLERRAFLLALLVHGLLLLGVARYEPALPLQSYTVRLAPVPVEAVREEAKPQAPISEARPAEASRPQTPPPQPAPQAEATPQARVNPTPPRGLERAPIASGGEERLLPSPSPAPRAQAEALPAPSREEASLAQEAAPPREAPALGREASPAEPLARGTGGLEAARPAQEAFAAPAPEAQAPTAEEAGASSWGQAATPAPAEALAPTPSAPTPAKAEALAPSSSGGGLAAEKAPPAPGTPNPLPLPAQAPGALPEGRMGPAREAALPPSRPAGELGREGLLPPGGVQGGRDWGRCAVVVDATPFPLDPNPNPQVLTPEGKRVWPPAAKVQGVPTEVVDRSGIALFFPQGAFDPAPYGRVLWVKALGTRTRTPESRFHDLVVVSAEDAARIQVAAESLCEMVFLYAKGGQP